MRPHVVPRFKGSPREKDTPHDLEGPQHAGPHATGRRLLGCTYSDRILLLTAND